MRLSSDFAEGAPFLDGPGGRRVSTRVFERNEAGDRAIDPMYPTFFVAFGSMLVLSDSAYPAFTQALRDALYSAFFRPNALQQHPSRLS